MERRGNMSIPVPIFQKFKVCDKWDKFLQKFNYQLIKPVTGIKYLFLSYKLNMSRSILSLKDSHPLSSTGLLPVSEPSRKTLLGNASGSYYVAIDPKLDIPSSCQKVTYVFKKNLNYSQAYLESGKNWWIRPNSFSKGLCPTRWSWLTYSPPISYQWESFKEPTSYTYRPRCKI